MKTSLLPMSPDGRSLPLIMVHALAGSTMFYRPLCDQLRGTRPFYALEASGLRVGESPIPTVEEMASKYSADIKEALGGGRFILGGYCFGGVVALSMAALYEKTNNSPLTLILIYPTLGRALKFNGEEDFLKLELMEKMIKKLPEERRPSGLAFLNRLREVYAVHANALKNFIFPNTNAHIKMILPDDMPDVVFRDLSEKFSKASTTPIEYFYLPVDKGMIFDDVRALEMMASVVNSVDSTGTA